MLQFIKKISLDFRQKIIELRKEIIAEKTIAYKIQIKSQLIFINGVVNWNQKITTGNL